LYRHPISFELASPTSWFPTLSSLPRPVLIQACPSQTHHVSFFPLAYPSPLSSPLSFTMVNTRASTHPDSLESSSAKTLFTRICRSINSGKNIVLLRTGISTFFRHDGVMNMQHTLIHICSAKCISNKCNIKIETIMFLDILLIDCFIIIIYTGLFFSPLASNNVVMS
jgi:hypothetical protein